jgi:hypothetical protein
MAPLPKPPIRHGYVKPLSLEAQASLAADADFLRDITTTQDEPCELKRGPIGWACERCRMMRVGEARPECKRSA